MKHFYTAFLLSACLASTAQAQTMPSYQWAKNLTSGTGNEAGSVIRKDASGNLIIGGEFSGTGTIDLDPSANTANFTATGPDNDVYIAKYDAAGNYLWGITYESDNYDYVMDMAVDAAGNIYVAGTLQDTIDFDPSSGTMNVVPSGPTDIYLVKYDPAGNLVWAKGIGSTGLDGATSLAADAAGNIYVTGSFAGTVDFDPSANITNLTNMGGQDIFVAKYDPAGNLVWAMNYGGAGSESGSFIRLDAAMNIYLSGMFDTAFDFDPSSSGGMVTPAGTSGDMFIAKLDNTGNFMWAGSVGGTDDITLNAMEVSAAGDVYTTGNFEGTIDFDPTANTDNRTSEQLYDMFFLKWDAAGNPVWTYTYSTTSYEEGFGISAVGSDVYVTGILQDTIDFDPGAGVMNVVPTSFVTMFVVKYDAAGNPVWAFGNGPSTNGNSWAYPHDMYVDATNIYITGEFEPDIDFDPSAASAVLTAVANRDAFLAVYAETVTGINDVTAANSMVYPNPFTASVNIQGLKGNETIVLYNVIGETVSAVKVDHAGVTTVNTSSLPAGVYFMEIASGEAKMVKKIVKQ